MTDKPESETGLWYPGYTSMTDKLESESGLCTQDTQA